MSIAAETAHGDAGASWAKAGAATATRPAKLAAPKRSLVKFFIVGPFSCNEEARNRGAPVGSDSSVSHRLSQYGALAFQCILTEPEAGFREALLRCNRGLPNI